MNRLQNLRQQMLVVGFILGIWGLLVLTFAAQLIFTIGLGWNEAIRTSINDWFPWAFLAPVVAWLAAKFPWRNPIWP